MVHIFHFWWFPLIYKTTLGFLLHLLLTFLCPLLWSKLHFPVVARAKKKKQKTKNQKKKTNCLALFEDLTDILPSILFSSLPCPLGDLTQSQGSHLSQTEILLPWLAFWALGHCFLLITGHLIWCLARVSNSVLYKTMSVLPKFSQPQSTSEHLLLSDTNI